MTTLRASRTLRTTTGLASIATALLLSSCGSSATSDDAGPTDPAPRAAPSSSTTPAAADETESAAPARTLYAVRSGRHTIRTRLIAPDRFRHDATTPGRLHFLSTPGGTTDDPWADMFLYVATRVHDPRTQELGPVPDDLVAWLAGNPGLRVLERRAYEIGGLRAHELNVRRDGSMLLEGDRSDDPPGNLERYVLVRRGDAWLVGQASTFEGEQALVEPAGEKDALLGLVRNASITGRG